MTTWGDPIVVDSKDTGFVGGTPQSRAQWLFDEIHERYADFGGPIERVLPQAPELGFWCPIKNEPFEFAFLRAFEKLLAEREEA